MTQQARTSNSDVRKLNRNRIFRYISRHGRISRPEIATALGLSSPTVLQLTGELLKQGVIRDAGEFASTGGRKARALSPAPDFRYAVGMDITSNHLGFVLTDLSGRVLSHLRVQQAFSLSEPWLTEMAERLGDFIRDSGVEPDRIIGVGISIPGIIDPEKEEITHSHALGIYNVPCEIFRQSVPWPCAFINDASAAGIAELTDLAVGQYSVYLSLSNSVGGAIISRTPPSLAGQADHNDIPGGSRLHAGDTNKSGEVGHMTLVPDGRECYCGRKGCFDAYCNAKILAGYAEGSLEQFFEKLPEGDPSLQAAWEEYLDCLAVQINSIRMLMDCNVIVGGYVGSFMEPYAPELRKRVEACNTFGESGDYLHICRYRVEASALGAALLHVEAFINSI